MPPTASMANDELAHARPRGLPPDRENAEADRPVEDESAKKAALPRGSHRAGLLSVPSRLPAANGTARGLEAVSRGRHRWRKARALNAPGAGNRAPGAGFTGARRLVLARPSTRGVVGLAQSLPGLGQMVRHWRSRRSRSAPVGAMTGGRVVNRSGPGGRRAAAGCAAVTVRSVWIAASCARADRSLCSAAVIWSAVEVHVGWSDGGTAARGPGRMSEQGS
jgi:hypothetical protein